MTHVWLSVLLLAAALEPTRGRLCIGEERCFGTIGTTIAVAPADAERPFVWTGADRATVRLGVIAAKADTLDIASKEWSTIGLSIAGADAPVTVEVRTGDASSWRWTLTADESMSLRRIIVPRGNYRMQLTAEHHRALRRGGIRATTPSVDLGELRLRRLPVALGIVVDASDQPIPGAVIAFPDATHCADANEQGAFVCELPMEPPPEVLVVSANGFGPRELTIARDTKDDIDFGRVRLSAARVLTLKITKPDVAPARVALYLDSPRRYEHSELKTAKIREREEAVRFEVAAGQYLVAISGEGPLERLEVPIEVAEEDVNREIAIEPYVLVGTARFGDDPVNGGIELMAPENSWRSAVPVENGAFAGTMWQKGVLHAWLGSDAIGGATDVLASPELGADPSRWDIRIEKRMIVGRVLDAESGAPLPDASLDLVVDAGGGGRMSLVNVKPDGSYRIPANPPGQYTLRVSHNDYMSRTEVVQIAPEDGIRTIDVKLERGVVQPLDIVWPTGAPIPNARIYEGVEPNGNPEFFDAADATGRLTLRGRPGDTRVLYVHPNEGSFAVARVVLPRSGERIRPRVVTVGSPAASLRVRTVDQAGQPQPAGVLIRYNGEFVPPAILGYITDHSTATGEPGESLFRGFPPGTYELWALTGRDEDAAIIASNGALRPPVRVGVSAGEEIVTVPIAPRSR